MKPLLFSPGISATASGILLTSQQPAKLDEKAPHQDERRGDIAIDEKESSGSGESAPADVEALQVRAALSVMIPPPGQSCCRSLASPRTLPCQVPSNFHARSSKLSPPPRFATLQQR